MFDSFMLRKRPDQTAFKLNQMVETLHSMETSLKVVSGDGENVIIIGEQPVNPATGKPYSFGIHTYKILGDRLEEI